MEEFGTKTHPYHVYADNRCDIFSYGFFETEEYAREKVTDVLKNRDGFWHTEKEFNKYDKVILEKCLEWDEEDQSFTEFETIETFEV